MRWETVHAWKLMCHSECVGEHERVYTIEL